MSYEKTNWKTGDVITSQKLNHIEDGIVSREAKIATVTVEVTEDYKFVYTSDISYNEVLAAFMAGKNVIFDFTIVDEFGGENRHIQLVREINSYNSSNVQNNNYQIVMSQLQFSSTDPDEPLIAIVG